MRAEREEIERYIERYTVAEAEADRLLTGPVHAAQTGEQGGSRLRKAFASGPRTAGPKSAPADESQRDDRKDLGASLVISGGVGVLLGIALHLALRSQAIDSSIHLGYLVGLVGVLLGLIGVIFVY